MDNVHVAGFIAEDSTGVVLKSIRDGNTAGNGTSLVDFLHHFLLALDLTELVNTVDEVLVGDEACLTGVAVTADVHSRADLTVVETTGAVDGASLISDFVLGHPLEGVVGLTTVATLVGGLARDDHLRGDVHIGPGTLTSDLDTIGEGGGGSVGPAGTAVGGDVLVADVRDQALSINVVPIPLGGKVVGGLEGSVDLGRSPVGVSDTARLGWVHPADLSEGNSAQKSGSSESFHLKRM